MKKQVVERNNIFANHKCIKGLKYGLLKTQWLKKNNIIKKVGKRREYFTKQDNQMEV
jgi:hypothetical protein